MIDKNDIEQYKIWFDNLSFFGNNSFVIDHIEDLWNLINYIGKNYQVFCDYSIDKDIIYTKLSKDECLKLVQNFFDNHNIDLNIENLIKNNILNLKENIDKEKDDFFNVKKDGEVARKQNNDIVVSVVLENTIYDSIILIHELMHYINEPIGERNITSHLLTEAISYGTELIFLEDLKNTIFYNDRNIHFKGIQKLMYVYVYQIYDIYKIILLYKTKNNITENLYNEMFNDGKYEITMKQFKNYVSQKKSIFRDTWYVVGIPLAIYFLEEYRKNKDFFKQVKEFNNSINDETLENCFSILGINNKANFIEKIKTSSESFIELLNELYDKKNNVKN